MHSRFPREGTAHVYGKYMVLMIKMEEEYKQLMHLSFNTKNAYNTLSNIL